MCRRWSLTAAGFINTPALGGACDAWATNATCHAGTKLVKSVVEKLCLHHESCSVDFGNSGTAPPVFGPDPCHNVKKTLAVTGTCSAGKKSVQDAAVSIFFFFFRLFGYGC